MFEDTLKTVPEDRRKIAGTCGVWTVQQVIAHLAGWQREALKRYRDFEKGDPSTMTYDIDAFNAASIAALSLLNWRETLDTYRYTCEDLKAAAEHISQIDPRHEEWMRELARENRDHAEEIKLWLQKDK
jgi:Mycothiol maleylpyruvate isomerase N-terminal domain